MAYNKHTWVNDTAVPPFLNETTLNEIEKGIEDAHNDIANLQYLTFSDTIVATTSFVSDTTYSDYGFHYKADITLTGVLSNMIPEVNFNVAEQISGNYSGCAVCGDGYVRIFAEYVPSADITIPTIICRKLVA